MRKKIKKIFSNIKDNSFWHIYLWVFMPILVLVFCEIIIYTINYNTNVNMITKNYNYKLRNLSEENDSTICRITDFLFILSENENFIQSITDEKPLNFKSRSILGLLEQFNMLKESSPFIDQIMIVKRTAINKVIIYSLESDLDEYFSNIYVYDDYSIDFWKQYTMPLSGIEYLVPTQVHNNGFTKFIYPIVFSKIGEKTLNNNYIIINIDIKKITDSISDEALTPKTDVLMLHNTSGKYFDSGKNVYRQIDNEFLKKIKESVKNTFYHKDSSTKYVVSHSPKNTPFGYSYAMTIPRSDLFSLQLWVLIISLLLLILALFVVFVSSKKLMKPWKSLESMFSPFNASENTVNFVHSAVEKTIESNYEIEQKLSLTLPFVQERYLIDMLQSSELDHVENSPITFSYRYFASIIIKLRRTGKFSQLYSENDFIKIRTGIYNIIKSIFAEDYDTFLIQNDNDTLYTLLNMESAEEDDSILTNLHQFEQLLKHDRDYITIHIGFGGTYEGLDGLRKSHADASAAISALPGVNMLKPIKSDGENLPIVYFLSMDNENKIYNYLLVGNIDNAIALINSILNFESKTNIDKHMLVQLYVQIIHVVMKAMKARGIPFTEENKSEVEMLYEIMACNPLEIYETIFKLLHQIEGQSETADTQVNAEKILEFINTNYTQELSLNYLADKFNISASYLSKLIKKHCGVGFANYIANLRIDAAKDMLQSTNKTVTDIYTEAGFNNRRTFIRTFKNFVGVSPTDYRKSKKN